MLFIVVIVVAAIWYLGFRDKNNGSILSKNDPLELLKERFVKGDIDEQTYLQMKETLSK